MDIYHVLNRGTDKRSIALDDHDRRRFVRNLYEMNDDFPVLNNSRRSNIHDIRRRVRRPLVQIHGWCLMGNHYHLLLSELRDGGMPKFLKKLNMGYSKYFNERHKRSGTLFQGKTKRILIESDRHYLFILLYIHCNPLDYLRGARQWRNARIDRGVEYLAWLEKYPWSSFRDYAGTSKLTKIIEGSVLYDDRKNHVSELKNYLKELVVRRTSDTAHTLE
jgi:putative transposase